MDRRTNDDVQVLHIILERHAAGDEIVAVVRLSTMLGCSVADLFPRLVQLDESGLVRLTPGTDTSHVVVLTSAGRQYVQANEHVADNR